MFKLKTIFFYQKQTHIYIIWQIHTLQTILPSVITNAYIFLKRIPRATRVCNKIFILELFCLPTPYMLYFQVILGVSTYLGTEMLFFRFHVSTSRKTKYKVVSRYVRTSIFWTRRKKRLLQLNKQSTHI